MNALTPFKSPVNRLLNELTCRDFNIFNDFWPTQQNVMSVRSWQKDDHLYVEADLPGVAKDDVEVSLLDEQTLRIAATRQETKTEGSDYYKETYYGRTERTLTLSTPITEEGCEAVLKDGVLRLQFKKTTKNDTRRIEIKTS